MRCIKSSNEPIHEIKEFNGYPVTQMGNWLYRDDYLETVTCGLNVNQQMDRVENFVYEEYDRKIKIMQQLDLVDKTLFVLIFWEKRFYCYKIPWKNSFSLGIAPLFDLCKDSCFGGELLLMDLCKNWVKRVKSPEDMMEKKIPMLQGLKPVPTCERCGGTISMSTMTCAYCNTQYYAEGVF